MEEVDVSTFFSKMLDIRPETAFQMLALLVPDPPLVEPIQSNFADVEEGDHLFYKTPFGMNVHFYVTANLGHGKIEVYGRFCKGNDDPFVEQKSFSEQTPSASSLKLEKRVLDIATLEELDRWRRQLYESTNIPKEKQRLEEYKAQHKLYGFLNNNSEHFVTFIKTGTAQCEVVSVFKKALIKHFAAHGGIDVLKAACKSGNWAALLGVLKKLFAKSAVENTAGTVAAKNVAVQTTESANKSGVIQGSKNTTIQTTKSTTKSGVIQVAETTAVQTTKSATKSGTVQAAAKAAKVAVKGTVVVQVVFEGAIYAVSMSNALYQYVNGHMSKEEFKDYTVRQSTTAAGSLTGGIGGSLAGIAAGAAIGSVFPVIGTTIGGVVGGFVGGVGGGLGGTALGRLTGNWINWLRS